MKPIAFEIMRLTPDHTEAMSAVHQGSFAVGWSRGAMDTLMGGTHCLGLGAFDKGSTTVELAGFLLLSIVASEAEVLTLAVDPARRRHGIARALVEQAILSAKASGAASLFLEVSTGNTAAAALYTTFGFKEAGRRPGYYVSENGADAVVMALPL